MSELSNSSGNGVNLFTVDMPSVNLLTVDLSIMIIRAIMIVWQAVLISQIIINEYQTKTINMLFTYQYSRGKIIGSKLVLISFILIIAHIFSIIIQHTIIYFYASVNSSIVFSLTNPLQQLITMISTIFIGFIPLFFGIYFKSNISTIVSSIVIVMMVSNSQGNNAGLISIPTIAIILGLIGLALLIFTIKKMLMEDL